MEDIAIIVNLPILVVNSAGVCLISSNIVEGTVDKIGSCRVIEECHEETCRWCRSRAILGTLTRLYILELSDTDHMHDDHERCRPNQESLSHMTDFVKRHGTRAVRTTSSPFDDFSSTAPVQSAPGS
jgi:hypothetical protein